MVSPHLVENLTYPVMENPIKNLKGRGSILANRKKNSSMTEFLHRLWLTNDEKEICDKTCDLDFKHDQMFNRN